MAACIVRSRLLLAEWYQGIGRCGRSILRHATTSLTGCYVPWTACNRDNANGETGERERKQVSERGREREREREPTGLLALWTE